MVYSQTKKTSSIASITNQNQGGGSKKAGLPYLIGRESWSSVALRNTSQRMSVLKMPLLVEVVIDLTVITDKFLKCRNRLETLHRSFSSSKWQM